MTEAGKALQDLVDEANLAAPFELAELIDRCARELGARGAVAYVADLAQRTLVPFLAPGGPGQATQLMPLGVDATLAGRAYQTMVVQIQDAGGEGARVWVPLRVGTARMGVLSATVDSAFMLGESGGLEDELTRLATASAALILANEPYSDALVKLRRRSEMGLAAEIQYALLPPLTFTSRPVNVAAVLEPCYHVAGDTIDYAVDADLTRVAVFDGMGHGLQSAQCAVLTVAAYRNARRSGRSITDTLQEIDVALLTGMGGEVFTTAVILELDTGSGLLQWVNAGHPEPLLLRNGRLVKSLHVEPRPPLGLGHLLDTTEVEIGREQLEPGDQLLLFTDGVVEARSPGGDFFGIERLTDLVIRHLAGGLSAPETMRRVVKELLDHQQDQLSDDASLLLLEWRSDTAEALPS